MKGVDDAKKPSSCEYGKVAFSAFAMPSGALSEKYSIEDTTSGLTVLSSTGIIS
jgi:hypothetical protein